MFNPSVTDSFDEMSFHYNYPIHRACRDGDVQTVSMALASDQSLTTAEDCFKHLTPIHWAATFGKVNLYLLSYFHTTCYNYINSSINVCCFF